jgi:trehalose synthase
VARLTDVPIQPRNPEPFETVVGSRLMERARSRAVRFRSHMAGRVVWNVSSTAVGGGVAEMLRSLTAYARGWGIDTRWVVIEGSPSFFRLTKRLHHALHGADGDGSSLGARERELYEEVLHENAVELVAFLGKDDVVLLHDPQTAGLIPHLVETGVRLVWRCHIGADRPTDQSEMGWRFLAPYLGGADTFVFSREAFIPDLCPRERTIVLQPSIDPFSPKNQELSPTTVRTILVHTGIIEGPIVDGHREFLREDGTPARVDRSADVIRLGRAPSWDTPLVVQVSRWDPLKDPVGVLEGFASIVDSAAPAHAELVLAGPNVRAVVDDPEGAEVFDQVVDAWRALPHASRRAIHLVNLPMADPEENGAIVNALQRHAAVVVQKSLQEGFGLTVSEAMWKARPVVASARGGIQDQIEDGRTGLLLEDPSDLEAFGELLHRVLDDPGLASTLGDNARESVRERTLGLLSLERWAALIEGDAWNEG